MNIKLPDGDFAAYIFDCDGTLADTMPLHYRAWCAALNEHNAERPEALFCKLGDVPTVSVSSKCSTSATATRCRSRRRHT